MTDQQRDCPASAFAEALGDIIGQFDHLPPTELFSDLHKAAAEIGRNCDVDTYPAPPGGWTCFHCGETFLHEIPARRHFGSDAEKDPACKIKGGEEHGLVMRLRVAEQELDRYRAEDSETDRQLYRMVAEHDVALRAQEELGYSRGLRDGMEMVRRLAVAVRAANDCDTTERATDDELDDWRKRHAVAIAEAEGLVDGA